MYACVCIHTYAACARVYVYTYDIHTYVVAQIQEKTSYIYFYVTALVMRMRASVLEFFYHTFIRNFFVSISFVNIHNLVFVKSMRTYVPYIHANICMHIFNYVCDAWIDCVCGCKQITKYARCAMHACYGGGGGSWLQLNQPNSHSHNSHSMMITAF